MADEIWSDLTDTLVPDSHGALKKSVNIEAVKVSIANILGTRKGERTFLPQFGSSLKDLIFEPINDYLLNRITNRLRDEIQLWDPRVVVVGLDIKTDPDNSYVKISVQFNIKGYIESFTTTTTINR